MILRLQLKPAHDMCYLSGFHVLLNIGQNEYIEGITESAGAVVVVHDQSRMPFPEDEGVLASPGHVTSISITRVDVSRLGDKYSDCIEPNKNELINVFAEHFPVNYSISVCVALYLSEQYLAFQTVITDVCNTKVYYPCL